MSYATPHIRLFSVLAVLAALCALLAIYRLAASGPAEASHGSTPGQIDVVAVDADPTGNTATSIASIDDCIVANPNDVIEVDVVLDEVDPADTLGGVDFQFIYNPAFASIVSIEDVSGVLMSADGSAVLSFSSSPGSDALDDPDSDPEGTDGSIKIAAGDFGSTAGNVGEGLVARVTLQLSGTAGVSDLSLGDLFFLDGSNNQMNVIQTAGAQIASGVPCPGSIPKTDLAVSDVVVDAPAEATAGQPFQVTADALIQNLGPDGPATVDVSATLAMPGDCSTTSANPAITSGITLEASEGQRHPSPAASWDVVCAQASNHLFTVTIGASAIGTVDNTTGNNQASQQAANAISSEADLKITSFNITLPAQTMVGKDFDITGTAVIHNNGPLASSLVNVLFDLSGPPGCRISQFNAREGGQYTTQASTSVTLTSADIRWRVRCTQPGNHSFTADGVIWPAQLHVTDSNSANDTWNAGASTNTFIGACQADPNPETNPFQDLGPTLLTLLSQLTADGSEVPEEQQVPLDCYYDLFIDDNGGGPVDDCESALIEAIPCDITISVGIDQVGGTPAGTSGTTLNPIAVMFLPGAFAFADDLAVPNGAAAGEASFYIRTDAGLSPFGGECITDAELHPRVGVEGGLRGNVPESNLDTALVDPHVWPNDLNAEVALVESSFDINPLITELTLWSRTVVLLDVPGVLELPLNIMIWRIDDPTLQTITQSRWVMVAFPGDAVNPDPPGSIGGDPDADDPVGEAPLSYCTPFSENITLYGLVGGVVRNRCMSAGEQVGWALMDPNAVDFTGDDGTRSNASPCSADADNDGLTATEEEYYGTDPANADSDGDGHLDGADNCPANSNPDQQNYDGDRMGDICDPDVDGDGTANGADLCPATPLAENADENGCSPSQVDFDADGVCNPEAPSGGPPPACTGSDSCPGTQSGETVAPNGCAQYQVDADADGACDPGAPSSPPICTGVDNCPAVANPDQSNVDGDPYGDACDGCPTTATAWPVPASDDDCDGYSSARELVMGTDPVVSCGFAVAGEHSGTWPPDLAASNNINIGDVLGFKPVFGDDNPPARLDLVPDNTINIGDVLSLKPFFGHSCSP